MQHLEEGTIHAWIDGALSVEEAREVEAHLGICEECANLAAEARGLVAASSRILTALDDVPSGVVPAAAPTIPASQASTATPIGRSVVRPWHTPFWIRTAAAVLVVAGTSALVLTAKLNNVKPSERAVAADSAIPEVAALSTPAAPSVETRAPAPVDAAPTVANQASRRAPAAKAEAAPPPSARGDAFASGSGRSGFRVESDSTTISDRRVAERTALAREEAERRRVVESVAQQQRDLAMQGNTLREVGKAVGATAGRVTARAGAAAPTAAAVFAPPVTAFGPAIRPAGSGHPAVGCYSLSVAPWSGGEIPFGAPPARIELDSLTSLQDPVRGLNLVHPAPGAASNGAPMAYWGVLADSVYVTWRDERSGVLVQLPFRGEILRGSARSFTTESDVASQATTVEARRISCRP